MVCTSNFVSKQFGNMFVTMLETKKNVHNNVRSGITYVLLEPEILGWSVKQFQTDQLASGWLESLRMVDWSFEVFLGREEVP